MNFKALKRRIEKLAAASLSSEGSLARQSEDVLRHWRETGELSYPRGMFGDASETHGERWPSRHYAASWCGLSPGYTPDSSASNGEVGS
jgi:hypothetical protein